MPDVDGVDKEEIFVYLDELQESAITNMFGAGSYVQRDFGVDKDDAKKLLLEWMETYEERHPD